MNIGQKAPDFSLPDTDKNMVSLSDYKRKNVVIFFFPFAFTDVCTEELCTIRDNFSDYEKMDAEVIGISVDSPFALKKYKEEERLNFTLLSDFNKEASRAYDSLYDEFILGLKGVSKRTVFLIDGEGIIRYKEIMESAGEMPSYDNLQFALYELEV